MLRISVLTQDHGFLPPSATGLPEQIQAARLRVIQDGGVADHLVAWPSAPPFHWASTPRQIRDCFAGYVVTLLLADRPGFATIACDAPDFATRGAGAAAAATIKRAWGWDEKPSIQIFNKADRSRLPLDPTFDGATWVVSIPLTPGAAGRGGGA